VTTKADFNAEAWATIVEAPAWAGLWVISAERGGTLRESMAMGRVYQAARQREADTPLLDEIVASPPALDRARVQAAGGGSEEIAQVGRRRLAEAMRILEEKATPQEVDAYKTFVMTVAQAVAAAHKEGGFLGIGGTPVSEAEDKALDEISITLGPPPAS
jgi:hypothetical protein